MKRGIDARVAIQSQWSASRSSNKNEVRGFYGPRFVFMSLPRGHHAVQEGFVNNDEVGRYLLARYKRVESKVGGNRSGFFFGYFPTRPDQFELVGFVGKYPEIDVVAAVLGGEARELGKPLDTFGKLATGL